MGVPCKPIPPTQEDGSEQQGKCQFMLYLGGFEPTTCPLPTRAVNMPSQLHRPRGLLCQWGVAGWTGRVGRAAYDPDKGPLDPDTGHGMAWHGMNGMVGHGMA